MQYLNPRENPNALVYLLMIILLAVFAGPNTLPQLVSDFVPFVDEGVPCARLRVGEERAYHQSLIGRSASAGNDSPLSLELQLSPLPATADEVWTVEVIVYNRTLGTVPILVTPGRLITTPTSTQNGFGIVANDTSIPAATVETFFYPEDAIRLLGPRQRCVHRVTFALDPATFPSQFGVAGVNVRAYYRNTSAGVAQPEAGSDLPAVYTDQGLWVGVIESAPVVLTQATTP